MEPCLWGSSSWWLFQSLTGSIGNVPGIHSSGANGTEGDDYKRSHHFRKHCDDQNLFGSSMILRIVDQLWSSGEHYSYANEESHCLNVIFGTLSDPGSTHIHVRQRPGNEHFEESVTAIVAYM